MKENYILNKEIMSKEGNVITTMSTTLESSYFIPHSYYYENLVYNTGSNSKYEYPNSCTYVALEMILTYYDAIVNDNVIAEEYDVPREEFVNSYESLNTSLFWVSPGIDDTFHEALINLGRELEYTPKDDYFTEGSDIIYILKNYLEKRNLKFDVNIPKKNTNKMSFCYEAIDSNHPVVITLKGANGLEVSDKKYHDVVGYGYDDTGIYANFGWKQYDKRKYNINLYNIYDAYYLVLNESHVCSNNYIWKYNGCIGTICPCGTKTCNHMSKSLVEYSTFYHKNQCNACKNYSLDEHKYYESDGYYICEGCGYKTTVIHQHNFWYKSSGNGLTHKAT